MGMVFIMKQIRLSQGLYCLVDDEYYNMLMQHKWHASQESRKTKWYAVRREAGVKIRMHRQIMEWNGYNIVPPYVIDHINHNSLDNRLENLEMVTQTENMRRSPGWKKKGMKCKTNSMKK